MLCLTYEPQHGLDVLGTCVTGGVSLVRCRMCQVDPVQIHTWERLVNRKGEQLVNHLDLLRADLRAMVVLGGRKDLTHGLKVDQFLAFQYVQFRVEL